MKESKELKLLKIGADWCQSCKVLDKTITGLTLSIALQTKSIDDMTTAELKHFGLKGVPTMLLLDTENNIIDRKIGNVPVTAIRTWLEQYGVEVEQVEAK